MPHTTHSPAPVRIRDAATVVVLRDRPCGGLEVLLLRRHRGHVFGAGADVFPGGAVNATDATMAQDAHVCGGELADAAWRMAALRECFEEAGLLCGRAAALDAERVAAERTALNAGRRGWADVIAAIDVQLDLAAPVAFARWTTPPGLAKRYATRFYALAAPADQVARPDGHEMVALEWIAPATALAEADTDRRWLMQPTRVTLEQLARYADTATALAGLARENTMAESDIRVAEAVTIADGLRRLTAPNPSSMTGPGTNSYIVGRGPYVIVDPGVDDETHLEMLIAACDGEIAAICLTHRHPDHVGGAAILAERTSAPVCAWPKPQLAHYDRPIRVDQALADGETLTIGNMRLVVRHTPGHAADHVAFELPEAGILLAGDALMSDATVVILPPDGDMGVYFTTLERLARLDISRIAPAHGRMLDDPQRAITEVIAHRREREAQILAALSADEPRTTEAIADALYPQLHNHMKTMAALQVRAHLLHLVDQGRAVDAGHGWRPLGN